MEAAALIDIVEGYSGLRPWSLRWCRKDDGRSPEYEYCDGARGSPYACIGISTTDHWSEKYLNRLLGKTDTDDALDLIGWIYNGRSSDGNGSTSEDRSYRRRYCQIGIRWYVMHYSNWTDRNNAKAIVQQTVREATAVIHPMVNNVPFALSS